MMSTTVEAFFELLVFFNQEMATIDQSFIVFQYYTDVKKVIMSKIERKQVFRLTFQDWLFYPEESKLTTL